MSDSQGKIYSGREDIVKVANATAGCDVLELQRLCRSVLATNFIRRASSDKLKMHRMSTISWPKQPEEIQRLGHPAAKYVSPISKEPNLNWINVGGYSVIKERIQDILKCLSSSSSDLSLVENDPNNLIDNVLEIQPVATASGLLLHGPSGCGKSMLAQIALAQSRLHVIQVDASDLLSKYVGETEQLIRNLFESARHSKPTIVFIDEIDSLAQRRGSSASGTGVEERALSQLLNEMDGIQNQNGIFVMGCTNRNLTELDSAILRPGRLEVHIEVGLPTKDDCFDIARVVGDLYPLNDKDAIIEKVGLVAAGHSGAAICSLFRRAMRAAIKRTHDLKNGTSRICINVSDVPSQVSIA